MSADALFWLALAVKMALSAGLVLAAAAVAERTGPVVGGLVGSLPLSGGPAFAFVALDHDAAFLTEAVRAGLALNAATIFYAVIYAWLAQRLGLPASLTLALLAWALIVSAVHAIDWSTFGAVPLNIASFAVCMLLARRYMAVKTAFARRRWYDVPVRAGMVAGLVAAVVLSSHKIGPRGTGLVALFPVIFTSLILILHPRIGGRGAAAVLSTGMFGMFGYGAALFTVQMAAAPWGKWIALAAGLAVAVSWNIGLFFFWRSPAGMRFARLSLSKPPSV